jgi:PAS domain S-box-containing protein
VREVLRQPDPAPLRPDAELAVALLEATQTIVCVHDREGRFVYFNRAAEEVSGYASEEAVGRNARELVGLPEEADNFELLLDEIWADRRPRPGTGHWRTRDGDVRRILFMNQPLLGEGGEVRYLVSTGLDVTEQERDAETLRKLHDEQAALRRVATFVAGGAAPEEVAQLVTEEVGRLLGADAAGMVRYNGDETATVIGLWTGLRQPGFAVGTILPLDGDTPTAIVYRTGRPARIDDYAERTGEVARSMRGFGYRSAVVAPITVAGSLWGSVIVTTSVDEPLPADAETRLGDFAELVALALASADARLQLASSRARLVEASDDARRRIERDLHDGAQQRLVSLALSLRLARAKLPREAEKSDELLQAALAELDHALEELRELARGIHPAVLTQNGLRRALDVLAGRAPIPVDVSGVASERFPARVEAAVYFLVSEALTNAVKHARASSVTVRVQHEAGAVRAEIVDDGDGGADAAAGSGLRGLGDRVEALGGRLELESPPGQGTTVRARLPLVGGDSR